MNVLIAEDDAVTRLMLQRAVEHFGHMCLVAQDGLEAWELFQAHTVDVVISDWLMPLLDGIELCRRVRKHTESTSSYTYFIVLTALGSKQHNLTAMQEGADDYLTKPLDPTELRMRLSVASRVTALSRQVAAQAAELEQVNHHLFEQARRDALTQLANRYQLHEDLAVLQARVERYGHRYCLMLFDVDFFKAYNDRYGHLAGDEVLCAVADAVRAQSRQGDVTYRYGGEEFLTVLPDQDRARAAIAADRLRQAIEALAIAHEANAPHGVVTISLGLAELTPEVLKSVDMALKEADAALYRAKEDGRNRVAISDGATVLAGT
jgi:two-component system, cell cycle response regulator